MNVIEIAFNHLVLLNVIRAVFFFCSIFLAEPRKTFMLQ